jgi:hypothetical protein
MTILGRILVVVTFLLSLLAAALIIMVHAASTNWHKQADLYKDALKVAQENAETYKGEIDRVRTDLATKITEVDRQLKEVTKERDAARAEAKDYTKRYTTAVEQGKAVDSSRESLTAELARRKTEIDQLNGLLAARDKRMLDIEKDKKELRDRAVSAEIAQKAEQERNERLLAQNEQLEKRLAASVSGTGRGAVQTPPEDVEGLVTEVDKQTGYLRLSIGSDAGLARGQTLQVYRQRPNEARYLGTVRIIEVRPNEAIARPSTTSASRTPIEVGDRVASDIRVRR